MYISLSKLQQVVPEFVDTRLMPSAPSEIKWILGGSTFVLLHKMDSVISQYSPMLKTLGIVTEDNRIDIEMAKGFINSAFDKSGNIEKYGFILDKADGEAFINLLEKYKDV